MSQAFSDLDGPDPVPFRLSRAMWPTHYALRFVPDADACSLAGHMQVLIAQDADAVPTNQLTLHLLNIQLQPESVKIFPAPKPGVELAALDGTDGAASSGDWEGAETGPSLTSILPLEKEEAVVLVFSAPLPVGKSFVLSLAYTAPIGDKKAAAGCFRCNEAKDRNFLVTHLEPVNARRLYPCFDEPWFKALYRVTVDFASDYTVLSASLPESETVLQPPAVVPAHRSPSGSGSVSGPISPESSMNTGGTNPLLAAGDSQQPSSHDGSSGPGDSQQPSSPRAATLPGPKAPPLPSPRSHR